MRKLLIMTLCLVFGLETWAQDERNARVVVGMNNLTYTVKKTKTLEKVLDVLLTGEVSKDQSKYQDAVRAAILKGISQSHRMSAIDGQLSDQEAALPGARYVDATVSNAFLQFYYSNKQDWVLLEEYMWSDGATEFKKMNPIKIYTKGSGEDPMT